MKTQRLFVWFLLGASAFHLGPAVCGQAMSQPPRPAWLATPKPQITRTPATAADVKVDKARDAMFDSPADLRAPDLTQPSSDGRGTGHVEDFSMPPPLPIDSSDAIVTGVVKDTQPFLSADHTRIYSELSFFPADILKDTSGRLTVGQPAMILGDGGSMRLPNGRIAASAAGGGTSPIDVGKLYLLFLHYSAATQAYTVKKAWSLCGERPQELDLDGRPTHSRSIQPKQVDSKKSLLALVKSRLESE